MGLSRIEHVRHLRLLLGPEWVHGSGGDFCDMYAAGSNIKLTVEEAPFGVSIRLPDLMTGEYGAQVKIYGTYGHVVYMAQQVKIMHELASSARHGRKG